MLGAGASETLLPNLQAVFGAHAGLQAQYHPASVVELIDSTGEPVARVSIENSAKNDGFVGLSNGSVAMKITTEKPNAAAITAISDVGFGGITSARQQVTLGMDGLVILVSQRTPVRVLSIQQIGAIFRAILRTGI
ncbi:MAG: hypothetical protein AAED33_13690 [Paracoccaceae bacterium]|jgi:hypothetical protein